MSDKPAIGGVYEQLGGQVPTNRGGWQKVACILHDDGNPSATLNLDEGLFHCFVCNITLDAYGLLMQVNGIDFKEAVALARELDIEWVATAGTTSRSGLLRRPNGCGDSGLSRGPRNQPTGGGFRPSWKSF